MIDYILEIEYDGKKKYYHDIVIIEFYERALRAKDIDGTIIYIDIRKATNVRIIPTELRRTEQ